jgi:hypothetical protein
MAYRFTDTEKWNDLWFRKLPQLEKLLFMYLCDNCDIAGFIEADYEKWAFDLKSTEDEILGAVKGLERSLIISDDRLVYFIKNYLKHQKNLPLNEKNKAHIGILKRFEKYKNHFDIQDIMELIEAPSKPLQRGTGNGIGIGIGINNTNKWKKNYNIYIKELNEKFEELKKDTEWLKKMQKIYPGIDIIKSMEQSIIKYWGTETGWKKKASSKTKNLDWKKTFANTIEFNKVEKSKHPTFNAI